MKSYFIDSVDVKLHVLADDEKDGKETILFLHGYPDTSNSWEYQFQYFKSKYRVAAYDLRGIKNPFQREIPTDFNLEVLMEDLNNVIEFLVGQNGKVHLVGHDWGSVISWCYISNPENVKKVFTFTSISCPHPKLFYENVFGKLSSWDFSQIQMSIDQIYRSWYILLFQIPFVPEILWETAGKQIWQKVLSKAGIPESDNMYSYDKNQILQSTIGNINLYREVLKDGGRDIPSLPLQKIYLPITVIIPENDVALSPMIYERTKDFFPNATLQNLRANHWAHREKHYQVNQIIENCFRDFMKNSDIYFHSEWDTENLTSGDILIQLKNKISEISVGNILKIKTKDSGLKDALFSWSMITGHKLLKSKESEFFIKRVKK